MKTLKSIYQSAKRNFTKSLSSQIKFDLDPAHSIISSKEHKSEFTLKINSDLFVYFLKEDGRIYVSAEYLGESEQEMCYLINKIFMSDGMVLFYRSHKGEKADEGILPRYRYRHGRVCLLSSVEGCRRARDPDSRT